MVNDPQRMVVWHLCDEHRHLTFCAAPGNMATVSEREPRRTLREGEFLMKLQPATKHLHITSAPGVYDISWPLAVSGPHNTVHSKTKANLAQIKRGSL